MFRAKRWAMIVICLVLFATTSCGRPPRCVDVKDHPSLTQIAYMNQARWLPPVYPHLSRDGIAKLISHGCCSIVTVKHGFWRRFLTKPEELDTFQFHSRVVSVFLAHQGGMTESTVDAKVNGCGSFISQLAATSNLGKADDRLR